MQVDVGPIADSKGASLNARGVIDPPGDLPSGFEAAGAASVEALVTNVGRFLHAEGRIDLSLRTECVRCLAPLALDLAIPFSQDYAHGTVEHAEPGREFAAYSGNVLILDPAVHEAILLALPMKPLCREGCSGLCAQCGKNLNEGICDCAASEPGRSGLAELARLLPKKEV